jgi:hypothetical protein
VRGAALRLGDVVEVSRGEATIERPGKLTMRIEAGTRAVVTHTEGGLVVALVRGAVEAQVVPVASGEAFAVDVGGSRVAVHGTHLRVARSGDHVTVDLNEGVVAVGNAPRVGSVIGSLVTAPAHAEFTAADMTGTLAVTHDGAAVRLPVALGPARAPHVTAGPTTPAVAAAPLSGAVPSHPVAMGAHPDSHGASTGAPASPATAPAVAQEPSPEQAISSAVRACMAERPHADNVTVLVSTTLHLDLADDGTVRAARFEPPVAPDVNGCAASSIYKARFSHGGTASIDVDFTN